MSSYLPSRARTMTSALQMIEDDMKAGRRRLAREARAARRAARLARREARRTPVADGASRPSLLARTWHLAR